MTSGIQADAASRRCYTGMPLSVARMTAVLLALAAPVGAAAQSLAAPFYEIGTPVLTDYFVDPASGDDANDGTSRAAPKRTVTSIWNSVPQNSTLSTGVRINLLPGHYGADELPNYWENRTGTVSAPIILSAAEGYGTVFFSRDINMAGTGYFYLLGVDIRNRTDGGFGDAFHCERCSHILLRGNSFNGAPSGREAGGDVAHETIKFNQSSSIYIENNNIQGADDNGIDLVAVQHGHIRGNRIHDTAGWCTYAKGGSSYILIESNLIHDCGEGGITAGQGTGFEFMEAPWLRFEANYIKIANNVIYNVSGAALGVNGGYNVLLAHNTAYRVGARSHLIEVVYGERSCDGDTTACQSRQSAGGWGPIAPGSEDNQPIGNDGVAIYNNVIANPPDSPSGSQHFAIHGPRMPTAPGIPSPQRSDDNLHIRGNIIWNGPAEMPLGIEDAGHGCTPGHPTCTAAQLVADNAINTVEPDFADIASFDLRPAAGGALENASSASIPDFDPIDTDLAAIPEGDRGGSLSREFSGAPSTVRPPGAFAGSDSSLDFPSAGGGSIPGGGTGNVAPAIGRFKITARRNGKKIRITAVTAVTDGDGIMDVMARVRAGGKELAAKTLALRSGKYRGTRSVRSRAKRIKVMLTARDALGLSSTAEKSAAVR